MKIPRHVAIIMDGNGRWAERRGLPRVVGHKTGIESVQAVIRSCIEHKIEVVTLFAFSIENWERPQIEVNYLMEKIFANLLANEIQELHQNNIQLRVIGDIGCLADNLQVGISNAEQLTAKNTGLKLILALSYSGRWDIVAATRKIAQAVADKQLMPQDITVDKFNQYICLHDLPEPDLLIRTSGEQRISNFMLWQLAYTELYFTDTLWPDFREQEFVTALTAYSKRDRRFGKC